MSAVGLGRVKTPWRKHRRVGMSGEVAVRGHFSGFGGFFGLEVLLMRVPAVLGGSATADGRMSATTMPSSPPGAAGCPGCS